MKFFVANTYKKIKLQLLLLKKSDYVAVDIETDGKDWRQDGIVGIGFYGSTTAFHIPISHRRYDCAKRGDVLKALTPFFANPKIRVCMHNGNFDRNFLESYGIPVKNFWMDTQVAYHLCDDNARQGLKYIMQEVYGIPAEKFKTVFTKRKPVWDSDPQVYERYLYRDVKYTYKLAKDMHKELKAQKLDNYFFKLDMPVVHVNYDMERRGIHIDTPRLKKFGRKLDAEIQKYLRTIYRIVGDPNFNPNSNPQMQKFVFEELEAQPVKFSKRTSNPSLDVEALVKYSRQKNDKRLRDFSVAILEYRSKTKLKTTYVDGILKRLYKGKINPHFNLIPVTGRLSSSDPNAQNIPRKSEIRHCFIAPKGYVLIVVDYSQIELRITAHLSKDKNMIKAYKNNEDIHQQTADACGCSRDFAKTINFGVIYLMVAQTLAKNLNISEKRADFFIRKYFQKYFGVKDWQKRTILKARKFKRTKTMLGRPRRLIHINSSNRWRRQHEEREGVNHPVQGTAGELCKLAMLDTNKGRMLNLLKCKLISQVHDELIFRCPEKHADRALKIIQFKMERAFSDRGLHLSVPIIAEGKYATSWGGAK